MSIKMMRIYLFLLFSFNLLFGQSFDVSVQNQVVNGSNLTFDLYIIYTGTGNLYLGHSDLVLEFNSQFFTNPQIEIVGSGLTTDYLIAGEILEGNRLILNVLMPTIGDQSQFNSRIQSISSTGMGTLIASLRISGITNPAGTSGLLWRTISPNKTIITLVQSTIPWTTTDQTAFGNYITPEDISLPVELSSFTLKNSDHGILIEWITQSEFENEGFELFRRDTTEENYYLISSYQTDPSLVGLGNSTQGKSYSFLDSHVNNGMTYYYKLVDVDINGKRTEHGPMEILVGSGSNNSLAGVAADQFYLFPNFPNPFNAGTYIAFNLPDRKNGDIKTRVLVYNMVGEEVRTLLDDNLASGIYKIYWDGKDAQGNLLASGVYFYAIQSGDFRQYRKMIMLK
jgi:hypothetical protein